MIQLYTSNSQDFNKNGIILNPLSCEINPKLNGENELEMEVILDNEGLYKNIARGRIITVPTPDFDEPQQYRIYDTKKSMSSNSMQVYARHIQFNLNKKVIFNKNVQGNGQQVLTKLLEDTNFIGTSDSNITDIRQYLMRNITNVIAGNEEDSFLNIWGGEIECNNYSLNIPLKRGSWKGIRVTFGYNLIDIEEDLNADEIVTRIYPYSGDLVLSSNTPYIDSPLIAKYEDVYEQSIGMSDIKVKERTYDSEGVETTSKDADGFNTRAEAEAEMIKRCQKLYVEGSDKIKANYVVKMQSLAKTTEYKKLGYDALEKVCLGDTVLCYNKNIDIEVEARCISYKWDCINQEYIDIELGQYISSYVDENLSDLDNLYKKVVLEKQYILLRVDSLNNTLHSEIKITEDKISQQVVDVEKDMNGKLEIQANKINAVVQSGDTVGSWELNESAFKVAFSGSSDGYTQIAGDGITINDGRFRINKNGNTVFYVNTSGRCTADGGFLVEDGNTTCKIDSTGILLIGENENDAKIEILDDGTYSGTYIRDDLYVEDVLRVFGNGKFEQDLDVYADLTVGDDLDVSGTKNCLQSTLNYGQRRINAYETCEYYFGDIGEGIIRNGECIVYIDDIFSECINTDVSYQVDIFEYKNRGSIIEIERCPNYFIIKGNIENTEFGWEIKAKRKGYENNRLECKLDKNDTSTFQSENLLLENNIIDITGSLLENESTNLENILLEEVV